MLNGVLLVDHNELRPTMANYSSTEWPNVCNMNKWMAYILGVAMFQCMRTASWSFNSYRKWMKSSQHNTHTEPRTTKKSQSMFWIHTLRWLQFRQKKKPTSRLANSTWNRIIASQRERERIYAANAHAKWNIPHIVALLYHVNASIFLLRSAYVRHRSQFNSLFVLRPPEHN